MTKASHGKNKKGDPTPEEIARIVPERLYVKYDREPKKLFALYEQMLELKRNSDAYWAHVDRNERDGNSLPLDAPVHLHGENSGPTYTICRAGIQPPLTRWYFYRDYTITLTGYVPDGEWVDTESQEIRTKYRCAEEWNIVRWVSSPPEFIQRIATAMWKKYYKGLKKTMKIYDYSVAHLPIMEASSFGVIRRQKYQTIENNTDYGIQN